MNRPTVICILIAVVTMILVPEALTEDRRDKAKRPIREMQTRPLQPDPTLQPRRAPATSDTTWLGVWNFNGATGCDPNA